MLSPGEKMLTQTFMYDPGIVTKVMQLYQNNHQTPNDNNEEEPIQPTELTKLTKHKDKGQQQGKERAENE